MHAVPSSPQRGGLPRTTDVFLRRVFMVVLFAVYAGGIVWLSRDRAAKHVPQVLIDAVEARRQTEELWLWRVMSSAFGPTAQVSVGDGGSQCLPRPASNRIPEDAVDVAATDDGSLRIVSLAASLDGGGSGSQSVEVRTLLVAPCLVNTSEWAPSVHRLRAKIPEKATRAIDKVAPRGAVVVEFVVITSDAKCLGAADTVVKRLAQAPAVSTLAVVASRIAPLEFQLAPDDSKTGLQAPLLMALAPGACATFRLSPEGSWLQQV